MATKRTRKTVGMFGMPNDATPEYDDEGTAARYFYCPKCKSQCNWEITEKRIDDLTQRRKDGQRDRRYGLVLVKYYHYKYNCTNKECGYIFGEWQREGSGTTWKETQKIENKKWYDA